MELIYSNSCEKYVQENGLSIDEACIKIVNTDKSVSADIYAQSEECYTCSPWKYLSIKPGSGAILKVNSTYTTNFYIHPPNLVQYSEKFAYHFMQHGIYETSVNSTNFSFINIVNKGNNEYSAILAMFLFFFFLYISWIGVNILQRKLEQSRNLYRAPLLNNEENDETMQEGTAVNQRASSNSSEGRRLNSLDTFRGLAITVMIFVNYKGGKFYFFKHAPWNGITVADLVFPWFLWIMGVSLIFSIKSQLVRGCSFYTMLFRILKRTFSLFLLGIILNSFHSNHLPTFRIPGVLQRISVCYMINAFLEVLFMKLPSSDTEYFRGFVIRDILWSWVQWIFIGLLVTLHCVITFVLPVPGCPTGYLGPGGLHGEGKYTNCTGGAAGYIDQLIFGEKHIYSHPTCKTIYDCPTPFDPEGLLATLTSLLTVQLGVVAGRVILYYSNHMQRLRRWAIWCFVLGLLGGILCNWRKEGGYIPLNKNLWSLSYVCTTASFAFALLLLLYILIDIKKYSDGGILRIAGMNSILLYVGHEITKNMFPWSWSPVKQNHSNHLLMSTWGTFLWVAIAYVLHKKKLYFSV